MFSKKILKLALSMLIFYVAIALGTEGNSGDMNIGSIATTITGSFANIVRLITASAYLAGFGLTTAALFKFKQHKENPQQVQLGTCVTMLVIGVCLVFLPSILGVGGESIFGPNKKRGDVNGNII